MDGWLDGWGWMDERMSGWMDGMGGGWTYGG